MKAYQNAQDAGSYNKDTSIKFGSFLGSLVGYIGQLL